MFSNAFERELIDQSPMSRVKKLIERNQIERYLDDEELKRFMPVLANQWRASIIKLSFVLWKCYYTGARKGEVIHLKWDDLDESNRIFGGLMRISLESPRIIHLNSEAQQIIQKNVTQISVCIC